MFGALDGHSPKTSDILSYGHANYIQLNDDLTDAFDFPRNKGVRLGQSFSSHVDKQSLNLP